MYHVESCNFIHYTLLRPLRMSTMLDLTSKTWIQCVIILFCNFRRILPFCSMTFADTSATEYTCKNEEGWDTSVKVVNNSRNKISQTCTPPFNRFLYVYIHYAFSHNLTPGMLFQSTPLPYNASTTQNEKRVCVQSWKLNPNKERALTM